MKLKSATLFYGSSMYPLSPNNLSLLPQSIVSIEEDVPKIEAVMSKLSGSTKMKVTDTKDVSVGGKDGLWISGDGFEVLYEKTK